MKNPVLYRRSFTLIELLVVVALTAILLAMLMPALKSVKNQAKSVNCVSNLRQCGAAAHLYMNEWNGLLLRYQWDGALDITWYKSLMRGSYLPTNSVSLCPAWTPYKRSAGESSSDIAYFTYGTRWIVPAEYQLFTIASPNQWSYTKASEVRDPANYPIYGDSLGVGTVFPAMLGKQTHDFYNSNTPEGLLHLRHAGKANLWFLDGHVEACGPNRIVEVLRDGGTPIEVADPKGTVIQIAP